MPEKNNPHAKHRERVRQEFLQNGFSVNTPPHKILELLLFYSIPRKDTNEIAHALLNRFGSISAVLEATPEELMRVEGVGENSAALIKLLLPIYRLYDNSKAVQGKAIEDTDQLCDFLLQKYRGYTEEVFSLLTINSKGTVIAFDILAKGDISSIGISTRNVLEKILERKAVAAVICHNHPFGNALPSNEDIETTRRIFLALSHINVTLMDHIIICDDDCVSLYQTPKYNSLFRP